MTWYVEIPRLNGRLDFALLAEKLNIKGFEDRVEYHSGGWSDYNLESTRPHLKFENEDDAVAYVLAHGGSYGTTVPIF